MTPDPYDEVLGMLSTMRSAQPLSASDLRVYREVLRCVPVGELREVVWRLVHTVAWRPAPAELLTAVAERRLDLPEPHAAWEQVQEVLEQRSGWYDLPAPVLRAAEYVGGPYTIRTSEQPHILRRQFIGAYEEFRRAACLAAVDRMQLPAAETKELSRGES